VKGSVLKTTRIACKPDVCVVGGGPAGLASAIALSQAGFQVTVVDRAVPPFEKACGEGLMPDTLQALHSLGIEIPFDRGYRFRGIQFSDARSTVSAEFPSSSGLGLRRPLLHELLLRRAAELDVAFVWGARDVRLADSGLTVNGEAMTPGFIVAADGQNSALRRQAGLDELTRDVRRYAVRRHYRTAPWSPFMELYWGNKCQLYITPVGREEVCVVAMSQTKTQLDDVVAQFPDLQRRLTYAQRSSRDMGALSVSRSLRRVCNQRLALVGDASGSVDAITGEGLCLAFQQALILPEALACGNLERYELEHRRLTRLPGRMAWLMLTLDKHMGFQRRALAGLASHPNLFASLLAVHVRERPFRGLFSWQLVKFCLDFLETPGQA
jgi:2-polyprenyl-6-methoxyphenol hydroxylase-like FAD-dependent oxidoreductase